MKISEEQKIKSLLNSSNKEMHWMGWTHSKAELLTEKEDSGYRNSEKAYSK